MRRQLLGFILAVLVMVPGCVNSRSPETCLLFRAGDEAAKRIRVEAAAIASLRKMKFADKSGERPWQELAVYLELEGGGVDVVAQQRREQKGWVCFYGVKTSPLLSELVKDFSERFTKNNIAFEEGRP